MQLERCFDLYGSIDYKWDWHRLDLCASLWSILILVLLILIAIKLGPAGCTQRQKTSECSLEGGIFFG